MTQNREVISVSKLSDYKVRSTVVGTKCPEIKLSYLVHQRLKPFIKEVQSYIFIRFLNKCPQENTKIATFDNLGIETVSYYLKNRISRPEGFSKKCCS